MNYIALWNLINALIWLAAFLVVLCIILRVPFPRRKR
jgi:hypothetical protein